MLNGKISPIGVSGESGAMKYASKLTLVCLLGLLAAVPSFTLAQGEGPVYIGNEGVPAPEFPASLEWINVDGPLSVRDLRGKVVLLDFWTYGCVNCLHVIPALKQLEAKYGDALVVIGVHSAKFQNEGESENLRQIVQRYEVEHPVVNDKEFAIWRSWSVQAWPSFGFIDPLGNVLVVQGRDGRPSATISGELPFEIFDQVVGGILRHPQVQGQVNREPLRAAAYEGERVLARPLRFPGKVLADVPGGRLFIADTGHHRIVVVDLATREVRAVIGNGQAALQDGAYDEASFQQPQGMALRGETLYVADTNNHAIRAINLQEGSVATVAGNGHQGVGLPPFDWQTENPTTVPLRSPWDLQFGAEDDLYIAMAGTHQIWRLDVLANILAPAVGNGREAALNASLSTSELAQPSGLHWAEGLLYFADSESSTLRVADIAGDELRVVSGTTENNLFHFGDRDGALGESLLQHPLGVAGGGGRADTVYIADTYNSRIKALDPASLVTTTLTGRGGNGGYRDGSLREAEFDEPGGLDFAVLADGRRRLYVADTNNHAIRIIDLQANQVNTLAIANPDALQQFNQLMVIGGDARAEEAIRLPEQVVASGSGKVTLQLNLPAGYKINDRAESQVRWRTQDETVLPLPDDAQELTHWLQSWDSDFETGETNLSAELELYWCEAENASLCYLERVTLEAPVRVVAAAAAEEIRFERTLTVPGS